MTKTRVLSIALCLACAAGAASAADVKSVLLSSFTPKGQATLDRLDQDATQKACSTGAPLSGEAAAKIIADNTATIRYPADGQYLGDWKNGDKIAQTGTGLQSSDDPAKPSGGNCYACHQLAEAEIAYGTIGPSLKQYGKLRGNSESMLKYTWAKIYNAQAFMPCSTMPRFGHKNILTEQQIRDVMALLFDPASPVNQ
ncbi:sulfur oxidation c-type cytochrome SoxX [Fontimonas sp. SYSU GA230001]|uniref:sulfur oxidation c-type cytochrome SoxX n=1 Tax=Fontimonas sp. SYSU GA230001 TaxID=3142450 RepID=UPI0032B43A3B